MFQYLGKRDFGLAPSRTAMDQTEFTVFPMRLKCCRCVFEGASLVGKLAAVCHLGQKIFKHKVSAWVPANGHPAGWAVGQFGLTLRADAVARLALVDIPLPWYFE